MRKIKFRAWNKKNKEMDGVWRLQFVTDNLTCAYLPLSEHSPQEIGKDVVLMQYTGLKDKNDKEIYEGDIVHCSFRRLGKEIYEVKWIADSAEFSIQSRGICEEGVEVIGNIYENPELIKENEKK